MKEMNEITINTNEPIYVVAISIAGWGKGKTAHEALRNLRSASRGMIDDDFGMTLYPNGSKKKGKHYDMADNLENYHIRIWLTNDDTVTTEWFTFKPSTGKWAIYLGDADNNALAYMNAKKED